MAKKNFYIKESEQDDFQVKIVNRRTDTSFIVKGCAGSGKTILALWKAKQIQNENRGSFQLIVFTKALMQYMSDGITQVGLKSSNVDYFWNWQTAKGAPSFDYIIVDEAQDFSEEDILLFKRKARKALLLYGDSAQQLYTFIKDKKTISMDQMAVLTGFPTEQLVFNHRLPKKIARMAQYISSVNDDLEGRCTTEGVEKPKILKYNSFESQLDAIAQTIKNRSFEDVGILFRDNKSVERAYQYYSNKGINVEAKHGEHMDLDFNSDNPKLMTYHSSKGLQFEAVFLPDCYSSNEDSRNSLYVAVTRTYQSLYIFHSGNLSPFFNRVPSNLYESSLTLTNTVAI